MLLRCLRSMRYPWLVIVLFLMTTDPIGLGWGLASETLPSAPAITDSGSPTGAPADSVSPASTTLFDLPPDGPLQEGALEGLGGLLFQQGYEAYVHQQMGEAASAFRRQLKDFPDDPSAPASRAFLAEATYRVQASPQYRLQAIDTYQTLVREFPRSANASRARWRIGDLYMEQGWFQEARNSFEWAIAEASTERDASIGSLGLGLVMLAVEKWPEASHTFAALKTRVEQEDLLQLATLGLADALYGEKRVADARSFYDAAMRRWPVFMRRRPLALLHFAETEESLKHDAPARALYTTFFNLFPQHHEAAASLIKIGDSHRRGNRRDKAELFYKVAAREYEQSPHASIARLRLAELGQDQTQGATDHSLRLEIASLFRDPLDPPLALEQQERIFKTISQDHPQDALGREALFHLAEHVVSSEQPEQAIPLYREVTEREGQVANDPWQREAGERLTAILRPQLVEALHAHDDWRAVELFHRHGRHAAKLYAGTGLIVQVAEAHRRLGFLNEAVKQYQALMQDQKNFPFRQDVLIGLGRTYLDQSDPAAARAVLDRYRLEYPLGSLKSEALQSIAEAWRMAGNHRAVVKTCRQWLKRYPLEVKKTPAHEAMLLLLAQAEEALGETKEAVQTYAAADRAGFLYNPQARIRYADLLVETNRHDLALSQYREVVRHAPESDEAIWARIHMTNILMERKQYREAQIVLRRSEPPAGDSQLQRFAAALQGEMDLHVAPEKGIDVAQSSR
jgi:TolA-binding protein